MSKLPEEIRLQGLATLEDLLAIPEAQRNHEILDGEIVEKQPRTPQRKRIQASLIRALGVESPLDEP